MKKNLPEDPKVEEPKVHLPTTKIIHSEQLRVYRATRSKTFKLWAAYEASWKSFMAK